MKITIRTIKGEEYDIEVQDQDTVATLKSYIIASHPPASESFYLLFSRKQLNDEDIVSSLNVPENGFLVLLEAKKKKKKKTKKKRAATTTEATSSETPTKSAETITKSETPSSDNTAELSESETIPTKSETVASTPQQSTNLPNETEEQPNVTQAPVKSQPAESQDALDENDEVVSTLLALGNFSRAQIKQAIEISGGNVNIAAELLLSQAPLGSSGNTGSGSEAGYYEQSDSNVGDSGEEQGGMLPSSFPTTLEGLKSDHSFLFFRALIQQDNSLLTSFLQNISKHSPQLMTEIQSKQQEFLQMVNAPFTPQEILILKATAQQLAVSNPALHQVLTQALAGVGGVDGALGGPPAPGPGEQYITVTREENEKIQRIVDMGFEKNVVIQTFFACDKDEQATINLLFDLAENDPTVRSNQS